METQLPDAVRLKLEHAISRYGQWSGVDTDDTPPSLVRALGNGTNNASFLFANQRSYVIRIDRAMPADNGLEPGAEHAALGRAAAAGLAPTMRYADSERGILVCDYLPPDASVPADTASDPDVIAGLLRAIHRLEPIQSQLDLPQRIHFYADRVRDTVPGMTARQALVERLDRGFDSALKLSLEDEPRVLCHNDLLHANRLFSAGRCWAIDWEYAAMGSRWFDLAAVIRGDGLARESADHFLSAYLGRAPGFQERRRLNWAMEAYDALEHAWHALAKADRYR